MLEDKYDVGSDGRLGWKKLRTRFLLKWWKDLMALEDDVGNTWFRF